MLRHVSPGAKDLLKRMMSKNKRNRPSAREALNHNWFQAVSPLTIEHEAPVLRHTPLSKPKSARARMDKVVSQSVAASLAGAPLA